MTSGEIVLRLAPTATLLSAVAFGAVATYRGADSADAPTGSYGNNYHGVGQELMPAILLALPEGAAGEHTLLAWSSWAEEIASSHRTPPAIRVICTDTTVADAVLQLPHVDLLLFVSDESSWAAVLSMFLSRNPLLPGVGLLGEGALPHPDLMDSIESMQLALFKSRSPTAILTRSHSIGGIPGEERWLSDNFVTQMWCNGAALEASMLTKAGLDALTLQDATLLEVLPRLIRDAVDKRLVLVDGTHVIGSVFNTASPAAASGSAKTLGFAARRNKYHHDDLDHLERDKVYIGSLEFALAYDDGEAGHGHVRDKEGQNTTAKTSSIVKAPWPPAYILETVAMNTTAAASKGLVLVTNVNCGYLDMATNFWLSVRSNSDAKVLFAAMDEVSFDFMDALDPGCAALFPSPKTERRHSVESGLIGDHNFAESVLVRPKLLHSILSQAYAVLWSDSDMVWLNNPLPLLPRLDNTTEADVMLQYDGNTGNKCTCFMFLKPTMMSLKLLKLWEEKIVESQDVRNQLPLQEPLSYMRHAGLRVDFLAPEVMPAGKHFFDHVYKENYVELYHEHTMIVHNNWIKGHKSKKERFQRYHLWSVGDTPFPECGNYSDGGQRLATGVFDQTATVFDQMVSGERLMIATGVGVSLFGIFVWYASTSLRARRRRIFNVQGLDT